MAPNIVDEYVRVAERLEERYANVDIQPVIALVVQNATLVPTALLPTPVCDDPDDDKFLACACASGHGHRREWRQEASRDIRL